jgi:hypothetical protein
MGLCRAEDSPGGPCAYGAQARYLFGFGTRGRSPPDPRRHPLAARPKGEDAPTIDTIEHTLTAGYARALALEAERWRLERRIAEVASNLGGKSRDDEHSELTELGQRLSAADGDLSKLRGLLSSLRSRADEVRQPSRQAAG